MLLTLQPGPAHAPPISPSCRSCCAGRHSDTLKLFLTELQRRRCSNRVRAGGRRYEGPCNPYNCGDDLLRHARCCAGADFNSKCHRPFPGSSNSPHFNHNELHDVMQLAGGELSNKLCSSLTAHDRRNLERDCEHGVRVGLHFEPARVSVQLRAGCSFTIGKSAGLKRRAFTIIRPPGCRPGSARLPW